MISGFIRQGFLDRPVGNNLDNNPDDVIRVKDALGRLGYLEKQKEPHGIIDRTMDRAIKLFQKDNNLEVDGLLYPGGETETGLIKTMQSRIPVPGRKPPAGAHHFDIVPGYKRDMFKGNREQEWNQWVELNRADENLPDDMKAAFNTIFAAEGGLRKEPRGSAYGGITKGALKTIIDNGFATELKIRHGSDFNPSQLTMGEIRSAYKGYFDDLLKGPARKQGKTGSQLLGEIGDVKITASVADTLLRSGSNRGAGYILEAANRALSPENTINASDKILGSQALRALKIIASDKKKHGLFLDALADLRMQDPDNRVGDAERINYFRFSDRR